MTDALTASSDAGVSIWLDDLSRERSTTGNLAELVDEQHVVGVTTNPTIFAGALAKGERYDDQVRELAAARRRRRRGGLRDHDRRRPRRLRHLRRVYDATDGVDGRVSIEVDPGLAHDTDGDRRGGQGAVADGRPAERAASRSRRPPRACPRSPQVLAEGISVNVTLIFSLERYRAVMDAYLDRASSRPRRTARTSSTIHSVASFFVSRVDTEIDKRLDAHRHRRGQRAARQGRRSPTPGWPTRPTRRTSPATALAGAAAGGRQPAAPALGLDRRQGPGLPRHDVRHRAGRAADTVNTMPEKTLEAVADHGEIAGDTVTGALRRGAAGHGRRSTRLGIDYDEVDRDARDRGRRQVREVLGRAARDRHDEPSCEQRAGTGGEVSRCTLARSSRVTGAARREAVAGTCRSSSSDGVAAALVAQDATLWGPDAEAEAAMRLVLGRACRQLLAAAGRRDRRAARRARGRGRRPRRAVPAWAARRSRPRSSARPPAWS